MMLFDNNHLKCFWVEAMKTVNYVLNRFFIRPNLKITPYELFKQKKPSILYFEAFGCKCFIDNNGIENLDKFDTRTDEGIFVRYS